MPHGPAGRIRHRLNRGGNRRLNAVLYFIVLTQAHHLPEARAYLERRTSEGRSKREAHRALKRFVIRMALEALAAAEAVRRLSDEGFSQLYQLVEVRTQDLIAAVNAMDGTAIRSSNQDIHMSIYRASGLPRLVAMIESLWATYPFHTLTWRPNRPAQIIAEHKKLLRILKERNPDKLALATAGHIKASQETLALGNAKASGTVAAHR